MKRLPNLDEQEHGHTVESAYVAGDVEALDAIDAAADRYAEHFRHCHIREGFLCSCGVGW